MASGRPDSFGDDTGRRAGCIADDDQSRMRELTEQGLLTRFSGVGTFIAEEKPAALLAYLGDFLN